MKKTLIVCLILFLFTVLSANVTSFVKSDCSVNGDWYNCYPNEDFSGHYGTLSTLTMNYKMQVEFSSTGVNTASISIEVDDLWQGESLALDSTVGNIEYWSSGDVVIDISSIEVEGHHEFRFSVGYNDGSGNQYDPEMMYYVMSFDKAESSTPITLASFTAEALKGKVKLDWITETETENDHFLIYRDGEVIAQVEGNGTTSEQHSYTYQDLRVQSGMHEYMLADVSYDGIETRQAPVAIEIESNEIEANFVLNNAYPNPFNPSVTFNFQLSTLNKVRAFIYNTNGEMIKELLNEEVNAGSHTLTWNAKGRPSGVYIVKMIVGDVVQSQKLVLMK